MASNHKRYHSSDSSSSLGNLQAQSAQAQAQVQVQAQSPSMLISLPSPRMPASASQMKRPSPLTPPSVTPPAVTVSDHVLPQLEKDRCASPTTAASALLAKVAISSSQAPVPADPKYWQASAPPAGIDSLDSTPTSTPPEEGGRFVFGSRKELPECPEGGYVSFPVFEAFGTHGEGNNSQRQ